jgi:hypothetical protein
MTSSAVMKPSQGRRIRLLVVEDGVGQLPGRVGLVIDCLPSRLLEGRVREVHIASDIRPCHHHLPAAGDPLGVEHADARALEVDRDAARIVEGAFPDRQVGGQPRPDQRELAARAEPLAQERSNGNIQAPPQRMRCLPGCSGARRA